MNGREKGKFLRIIFINQLFISILFEIMILYTEIRQASAAVGANWNCMLTISPSEESGLLYKNVILLLLPSKSENNRSREGSLGSLYIKVSPSISEYDNRPVISDASSLTDEPESINSKKS